MHVSGWRVQFVSHLKISHDIQPIGGVRARLLRATTKVLNSSVVIMIRFFILRFIVSFVCDSVEPKMPIKTKLTEMLGEFY